MIFNTTNLLFYRALTSRIHSKTTLRTMIQPEPEPKLYTNPMTTWKIAKAEVKNGDPQQGGDKAWLALDILMREMARNDGQLVLNSHFIKNQFMRFYQDDYAALHKLKKNSDEANAIGVHYGLAQLLHSNFYDGNLPPDTVKLYLEHVKKLIAILQKFRLPEHRYPQLVKKMLKRGYIEVEGGDGQGNRLFRWPDSEEREKMKQERKLQKQH